MCSRASEFRDLAPLGERKAVRIRVEDLNANLIGTCRDVVKNPPGDVFEVSPCDEAVDQAVAAAVRGVLPGEAETAEVVGVVRQVEITRDVATANGARLAASVSRTTACSTMSHGAGPSCARAFAVCSGVTR